MAAGAALTEMRTGFGILDLHVAVGVVGIVLDDDVGGDVEAFRINQRFASRV